MLPRIAECQSSAPQTNTSNEGDYARVKEFYPNMLGFKYHTLHDFPPQPDGSKGYTVSSSNGGFGPRDSDVQPLYQDSNEYSLHLLACDSSAIVVATMTGSEVYLSQNKSTIFTRYHFTVKQMVKEGLGTVAVGANVDVIHFGGTVVDAGERLTVKVAGADPYKTGETYLLYLYHDSRASSNVFYSRQGISLSVTPENIIRDTGKIKQQDARDGETVDQFKQRLQAALIKDVCR
jgi:hypothetical protein